MSEEKLLQILEGVGAVIKDSHIVYTSGKHGTAYVNWVAVLMDPQAAWEAATALADLVWGLEFDTVVGPTHTGDKVASHLALALAQKGKYVRAVYAQEEESGLRGFPRGQYEAVKEKRVLVVDDVLTTGGTIRETLGAVVASWGDSIGVVVCCNRSDIRGEFDRLPFLALLTVPMETWDFGECPACVQQVPVNTAVGHGGEWLAEHPDPNQWPAFVKAKSAG